MKSSAIVRVRLDPDHLPVLTAEQEAGLAAMAEEEINAAAESDPDNLPLTDADFVRLVPVVDVRALRARTGLSRRGFADRFRLPLHRLRQWETRQAEPDAVARVLLRVIERDPAAVERAIAP